MDEAPAIEVECSEPGLSGERNLCYRAVRLIAEKFNIRRGARVIIRKNIPVGAGLGGGSADAAATLRLLNILWELDLPDDELRGMALSLGSDVPFFIGTGSAHARSRGELLSYFRLTLPYPVLVVFPGIPIPTGAAYDALTLRSHDDAVDLMSIVRQHLREPDRLGELLTNDFEEHVFHAYPEIASIKEQCLSQGALLSLLSGSGSSVFALFSDENAARAAHRRFADSYRTFLTPAGFSPSPHVEHKTD